MGRKSFGIITAAAGTGRAAGSTRWLDQKRGAFPVAFAGDGRPQHSVGRDELVRVYPPAELAVERVNRLDDRLRIRHAPWREHDVEPPGVVRITFGARIIPLFEPVGNLASGLPRHAKYHAETADRHRSATKEP